MKTKLPHLLITVVLLLSACLPVNMAGASAHLEPKVVIRQGHYDVIPGGKFYLRILEAK